jgi:hypothetical protein
MNLEPLPEFEPWIAQPVSVVTIPTTLSPSPIWPDRCSLHSWRNGMLRSRKVLTSRGWKKQVSSKHSQISSTLHSVDSTVSGWFMPLD